MIKLNKNDFNGLKNFATIHKEGDIAIVMVTTIVISSMQPSVRYFVAVGDIVGDGHFYLSEAVDEYNTKVEL